MEVFCHNSESNIDSSSFSSIIENYDDSSSNEDVEMELKGYTQYITRGYWKQYSQKKEEEVDLVIHGGSIPGKGSACIKVFVNERQYHSEWVTCDDNLPSDTELHIPFLWGRNDEVHIVIYRTSTKNPELYGDSAGRIVAASKIDIGKLDPKRPTTFSLVHSETPYITSYKQSFPVFTLFCTLSKLSCKNNNNDNDVKDTKEVFRMASGISRRTDMHIINNNIDGI